MKIDLNAIDQTRFMIHAHDLNGETVYLVQPQHIGCHWDQNNKMFRSSLWNSDGLPISLSFPKFVNWGENPGNFPVPKSLKNCQVVEKIDGSLLIVSKYKGNYILRTRGTVDATKLDNGHELEIFERDYLPKLGLETYDTAPISILFEWVSPEQRIILNYGEQPEWYLVGIVYHSDYNLWTQSSLDEFAQQRGFKRPPSYTFPGVDSLIKDVETWKGKEGVVVYSGNDQILHKVKGLWYLALHRMKEALASIDKVIDVWYEQGEPSYEEFQTFITSRFDWEIWSQIQGEASRICDSAKQVEKIIFGMNVFVRDVLKPLPSRKDQALRVISSYGNTGRSDMIFTLLDGKPLKIDHKKKLLYQCLKK